MAMHYQLKESNVNLLKTGIRPNHNLLNGRLNIVEVLYPGVEGNEKKTMKEAILKHYINNSSDMLGNLRAAFDIYGDMLFKAPTVQMLNKITESGNAAYLYYFDQSPDVELPTNFVQMHLVTPHGHRYGTIHGMDMFYVFGYGVVKGVPMSVADVFPPEDKNVSRSVIHSWTHFAKYG